MKSKFKKCLPFLALGVTLSTTSSKSAPHKGLFPFSMMEKAPSSRKIEKKTNTSIYQLECVQHHSSNSGSTPDTSKLELGDIIAFYMPHKEARKYLRKGKIQKVPYELFSYGHLATVIRDPQSGELRLLQVAMKQRCNIDSDLSYLNDKSWQAFRPPSGSINPYRLEQFVTQLCHHSNGAPKYDYTATFGFSNGHIYPESLTEIKSSYTCTTLSVAALHYAGFSLYPLQRGGIADVLTPRQVITAWGKINSPSLCTL